MRGEKKINYWANNDKIQRIGGISYAPVGNIFNEKKLDAVGAEDKDIDNDGDTDDSDKFLHKRRKAVSKAIKAVEAAPCT